MRRQVLRRRLIWGSSALSALIIVGLAAFAIGVLPRNSASRQAELSHRQYRVQTKGRAQTVASSGKNYDRAQWLQVGRVRDGTPTATPSQPGPGTWHDPTVTSTTPVANDVPAPTTDTTSNPDTGANNPAPTAEVVTPAPAPEIVVAVPAPLPEISLPVPLIADLTNPAKKDIAMQLVSSAENSSLDWKDQYGYLEDIGDGRGYTGGIVGFCSGTGDMLDLVKYYTKLKPSNPLAPYLGALQKVDGTDSHAGLGAGFEAAWKDAASDPVFQQAQNDERDRVYFNPAVNQAKADGLRALGQFIYYDAIVMHGPGDDSTSFGGIRAAALKHAKTPAQGGDEATYLNAFLDARVAAMKTEAAHDDVSRVETEQRNFVQAGNFDLNTPLAWKTYGDPYTIQ